MGFRDIFKKGNDVSNGLNAQQSQSPEISYDDRTTKREKQQVFGHNSEYTQTPTANNDYYQPPPGPPPSHTTAVDDSNPPPYQDWLSVPDNSALPPPPTFHDERSPANNATEADGDAGHEWCDRNPIYIPAVPNTALLRTVKTEAKVQLAPPPRFSGDFKCTFGRQSTTFSIKAKITQRDCVFLSQLPLYFAISDNPLLNHRHEAIEVNYSITVKALPRTESIVSIGLVGKPYPPFRHPGWERGSFAVHSDDGRRYINDSWGGIPFTTPFQAGDNLQLKLTVFPRSSPVQISKCEWAKPVSNLPKCETKAELFRNGISQGSWYMHEEKDSEVDEGIEGLQGEGDLYVAVGVSAGAEVDVHFQPQMYPDTWH